MNKELKTENQVLRTKYNGPILELKNVRQYFQSGWGRGCLLYTSDAADE